MTPAHRYTQMIRAASKFRARAIRSNPRRVRSNRAKRDLISGMARWPATKKALNRTKKFWGIKQLTDAQLVDVPGNKKFAFAGMGRTRRLVLADGPRGKHRKIWKVKGTFRGAVDPSGKRIFMLRVRRGKTMRLGNKLKFVGYAAQTHYEPTRAIEKAGSFKKGKYWVHKHDDEGGAWPRVYRDQFGNYVYGPGTYTVGKWIRR